MLDAAREAFSFGNGQNRNDLEKDRMRTLSILKSIEIIGEAASKTSKEAQIQYPEIPWADIMAMRNRLIHVYFDIDLDRVVDTINDDLPPLIKNLEKITSSQPIISPQ
jgi:uncharacterized protein with HEPN domain